jgi:hypothetical protein
MNQGCLKKTCIFGGEVLFLGRMYAPVTTKDPTAVEVEVQAAYLEMFPRADRLFIPQIFGWAIDCFTGQYDDYQPIDAQYHDFEHTLQGTLCLARLFRGRHSAKTDPAVPERLFQLGIIAILFHDTGYLKAKEDIEGTGAKYTVVHVRRSAEFAAVFLKQKHYSATDIKAVQNMILCTGLNAPLSTIPFQSDLEKTVGFALATADLLGQMAADDYVDKLPILYAEFAEAAAHEKDRTNVMGMFSSAEDLKRKTPAFWDGYVQLKLNRDFGGLYRFCNDPFPFGPNYYMQHIEANMERLRREFAPKAKAV